MALMSIAFTSDAGRNVIFFEKLQRKNVAIIFFLWDISKLINKVYYRNSQNDRTGIKSRRLVTYCTISLSSSIFSTIRLSTKWLFHKYDSCNILWWTCFTFVFGMLIEHFHIGKLFSFVDVIGGLCRDILTPSIFAWTLLNFVFDKCYQ